MRRLRCVARLALGATALLAWATGCDASDADVTRDAQPSVADAGDAGRTDAALHVASVDGAASAIDAGPDAAGADDDAGAAPAPIVGPDYVDFGALAVPASGSVRVELDVPEGTRGVVVTADPGELPRRVSLLELRGADGFWFDARRAGEPPDPGAPLPFVPAAPANVADEAPYAFAIPSSPERPLLPGHYVIDLHAADARGGSGPGTLRVDAVLQTSAPSVPARLRLAVWSASADAGAATLAADPQIVGMVEEATRILATADIALEVEELRELAGPDAGFGTLDGDAELGALLAELEAAAGTDVVAHAVLVDRIASGPGKTVLAKTTGLPGAPAHPSFARRSAVVLALRTLPSDAAGAGAALAHELGHLLGLRHTSDPDGGDHDPIADTPECPPEAAAHVVDGIEPLLSPEDCAGLDGENLMFYAPSKSGLTQETLTAGQRYVLARSPLLR